MATPIVAFENIHKWYSGVHALKGVDLAIQAGEMVGLLGSPVPRASLAPKPSPAALRAKMETEFVLAG